MGETDREKRRRVHLEQHQRVHRDIAELKGLLASTRMEQARDQERLRGLETKISEQALVISKQSSQLMVVTETMLRFSKTFRAIAGEHDEHLGQLSNAIDSITDDGR